VTRRVIERTGSLTAGPRDQASHQFQHHQSRRMTSPY
jgi:hypothetical protein